MQIRVYMMVTNEKIKSLHRPSYKIFPCRKRLFSLESKLRFHFVQQLYRNYQRLPKPLLIHCTAKRCFLLRLEETKPTKPPIVRTFNKSGKVKPESNLIAFRYTHIQISIRSYSISWNVRQPNYNLVNTSIENLFRFLIYNCGSMLYDFSGALSPIWLRQRDGDRSCEKKVCRLDSMSIIPGVNLLINTRVL